MDWLRNLMKSVVEKRQETLNAYVDGRLSPQQQARFEQELARNERLRNDLARLRLVRQQLRGLPPRRVPRHFTLDPALYGRPQREPLVQAYPALRLATALTAFFFVLALALQMVTMGGMASTAAPIEQVAMEMEAPAAAEALDTAVLSGAANDIAVEEVIVTMEVATLVAATSLVAATPQPESAVLTEEVTSDAAAEAAPEMPSMGVAAAPVMTTTTPTATATAVPTAAPTPLATASAPDLPRPGADETVTANRAATVTAGVALDGDIRATEAGPARVGQPLADFWLPLGLGLLFAVLGTLTLLARRRL